MAGTDDLSSFLSQPEPGRIEYGQGILTAFDPNTFSNEIRWQDVPLTDAIIAPGVDALSLQPGDPVLLLILKPPEGGTPSFVVLGRMSVPPLDEPVAIRGGTFNVEGGGDIRVTDGRLIAADGSGDVFRVDPTVPEIFMRQALISDLAKAILGDAVHFAFVAAREEGDTESFVDLATVGPQVTDVEVTSGTMIVIVAARIEVTAGGMAGSGGNGHMSYEVDGPTSRSPNVSNSASFLMSTSSDDLIDVRPTCATVQVETGLDNGSYDVTAKYQTGPTGAWFGQRGMLVIGL